MTGKRPKKKQMQGKSRGGKATAFLRGICMKLEQAQFQPLRAVFSFHYCLICDSSMFSSIIVSVNFR